MTLYSASAEERDTTFCFLECHEMRELPRNKQKPEIEWHESEQVAQSTSAKILSSKVEDAEKKNPNPMEPFKYLYAAVR